MDLSGFTLKELLLAAIKSEVESREVYSKTAERVDNAFLKDRLKFLAGEEEKHRTYIEGLYRNTLGEEEITLPESTPVPLPEIGYTDDMAVSEVVERAIEAERAAKDFYLSLSELFSDEGVKKMLRVLSRMEEGHQRILEAELENIRILEEYVAAWPMMHSGP